MYTTDIYFIKTIMKKTLTVLHIVNLYRPLH